MSHVTFEGRVACILCGCQLRGFRFSTVRINKRSMRETAPALIGVDRVCPECSEANHAYPQKWTLLHE